jgi:hypothetical protein
MAGRHTEARARDERSVKVYVASSDESGPTEARKHVYGTNAVWKCTWRAAMKVVQPKHSASRGT